jgi:hypothetical protein
MTKSISLLFTIGLITLGFLSVVSLTACTEGPCMETDKVAEVGQCAYSKLWDVGDSDCVALTERGYKVHSNNPYVKGELVCIRR